MKQKKNNRQDNDKVTTTTKREKKYNYIELFIESHHRILLLSFYHLTNSI